jgi:hypothetical protein
MDSKIIFIERLSEKYGASIFYRLFPPDILSGATDPCRRTGCPQQIAFRMNALLLIFQTASETESNDSAVHDSAPSFLPKQ